MRKINGEKKTYEITVLINGGEYLSGLKITCSKIKKIDKYSIEADGIPMTFDKDIYTIYDKESGKYIYE